VDPAGALLTVVVLLVATGPLSYLPTAALAAVVFLIGAELIDLRGLRRVRAVRRTEFAVALLSTAAVWRSGSSGASGWPWSPRSSTT
jgi:SulP family sulfate permease